MRNLAVLLIFLSSSLMSKAQLHDTLPKFDRTEMVKLVLENPRMIDVIKSGGGFGGDWSRHVGANIFSHDHKKGLRDVRKMTKIDTVAPGIWHVKMPIVNFSVVETQTGLVMIDAGYGLVGSMLDEILLDLSPKPLIAVIYTHGHVDHAFGLWKIVEKYPDVEVIAQENIEERFKRYVRLNSSLSKYMSQKMEDMPSDSSFFVYPTRTFKDQLSLTLGGRRFDLYHYKGETDDQLFVHMPNEEVLFSADYYVGFFPNIGNGKRVQRYIESWSDALGKMISLEPSKLVPSHGDKLIGFDTIRYELNMLKTTYDLIIDQTIEKLNEQWRKDEVVEWVELPDSLVNHEGLKIQYTSYADAAKMLVKQYTGWYDDVPSNWNPATKKAQSLEIIQLAGGFDAVIDRIVELKKTNVQMACHLVDMVFIANPYSKKHCDLLIDIYKFRILETECYTQEILEYLRWMTIARLVKKKL